MSNWLDKIPDGFLALKEDGIYELKIIGEPRVINTRFGERLAIPTDKGIWTRSLVSRISKILKQIALKLEGKISGLVIKVQKQGTFYDILEARMNDKIVYSKWQDKVDKAENNAKKCAEIIDKEFEHDATYDLKTTENLLRTKGYQFGKDTIFHAWRILVEEGKAIEISKETWYLKP